MSKFLNKVQELSEAFKLPTLNDYWKRLNHFLEQNEEVEALVYNDRMLLVGILTIQDEDCHIRTWENPIDFKGSKETQGFWFSKDEIEELSFTANEAPTFKIKNF